jgi:hypothetical protein
MASGSTLKAILLINLEGYTTNQYCLVYCNIGSWGLSRSLAIYGIIFLIYPNIDKRVSHKREMFREL